MSIAIAVASTKGRCLPVMLASCREYVPGAKVYLRTPVDAPHHDVYKQLRGAPRNFGDDYNEVIDAAFADGHEFVLVANDDVVLTPTSVSDLLEDVATLGDEFGDMVGWVCSRCDAARPMHALRCSTAGRRSARHPSPAGARRSARSAPSPRGQRLGGAWAHRVAHPHLVGLRARVRRSPTAPPRPPAGRRSAAERSGRTASPDSGARARSRAGLRLRSSRRPYNQLRTCAGMTSVRSLEDGARRTWRNW